MKIVTMGDSNHTISGFGTALRFLDTYLHNVGHEVYHIGFQSFGQETIATTESKVLGYKVLPNIGGKRFGEDAWKFWLPKIQPDVFLTLADFWMLIDLFRNDVEYPWCGWYPIDGYPLTDQLKEMLKKLDYRVCMSEWGAEMVRKEGFTTHHIPHGVDTSIYYPRNKKENYATRDLLGIPRNCILLGVFGRNQDRKKHPRAIQILKKIRDERPNLDIRMLLWMDKRDTEGWDMEFVVKRFGFEIGKDVFFPPQDIMPNFMYGAPSELMAQIMACCDLKLDTTGGEGFGLCVGSDTVLNVISGAIEIGKDVIGCEVLSKEGKFKEILKKKSRDVEDYYIIKTEKNSPLKISEEHSFFATKASRHMLYKYPTDEWLSWIPAGTIDIGDFIATPIPKLDADLPKTIDMTLFDSSVEYDDKQLWYKMGFSPKIDLSYSDIVKNINTTKKIVENTVKHMKNNENMQSSDQQLVYDYLLEENYELPKPKKYKRYIQVDDDLLWLFGWYLAEGSTSKGSIEFSMGGKDAPYINRIMQIFKEKFGDELSIIKKEKKIRLFASGTIYEKMFKIMFGYSAKTKHVPEDFMLGGKSLIPLVEGLILGDGHIGERIIQLQLISRNLIYQTWAILLSNRMLGSIGEHENNYGFSSTNNIHILRLNGKSCYKLNEICGFGIIPPNRTGSSEIFLENYVLTPVREINHVFEKETLEDIQVMDAESFVGNGYLLHNTNLEAMACGTLVIATDYTTPTEILGNWTCGLPIKVAMFDMGNAGVDRALVDVDHGASQVMWAIDNPDEVITMQKRGVERAKKVYDWGVIVKQFDKYLRDIKV